MEVEELSPAGVMSLANLMDRIAAKGDAPEDARSSVAQQEIAMRRQCLVDHINDLCDCCDN